jgi:hypothetical protein
VTDYARKLFGAKKSRSIERLVCSAWRLATSHQALGRIVMVILQARFVTHYLAIEFVYQLINSSIQISV